MEEQTAMAEVAARRAAEARMAAGDAPRASPSGDVLLAAEGGGGVNLLGSDFNQSRLKLKKGCRFFFGITHPPTSLLRQLLRAEQLGISLALTGCCWQRRGVGELIY